MRTLLTALAILAATLAPASGSAADSHEVSFDSGTDFQTLETFAIRSGHIASDKPEIDNRLFRQRMEYSIRETLVQKGFAEAASAPAMIVTFHYDDRDVSEVERNGPIRAPDSPTARGFVIPGSGPNPVLFTEGTLVIDMHDADGNLLWRGIWRDQEKSGPKLSANLSVDARKLLREFPPRRKQGLIIP